MFVSEKNGIPQTKCVVPKNYILRKVKSCAITDSRNLSWDFLPTWTVAMAPYEVVNLSPPTSEDTGGAWMMGASRCQGPLEDFWVVSANGQLLVSVGGLGLTNNPFHRQQFIIIWLLTCKENMKKNYMTSMEKTNHAMKHVWAGFKMADFTAIVMLVFWGG